MSGCPAITDAQFEHFVKPVTSRFLYNIDKFPQLQLEGNLWSGNLEPYQYINALALSNGPYQIIVFPLGVIEL